MVKRSLLLLMVACSILFTSCEKDLEKNPLSSISPSNFYKTENDCRLALNSVYSDIGSRYTYGESFGIQFMVGTDEAVFSRSYNSWTMGL